MATAVLVSSCADYIHECKALKVVANLYACNVTL